MLPHINLQKGFTLVELIAVITIMGLLAAIAGPKFIGNDVFEVSSAHGSIAAALRYAQKTAIAQRTTVYARVNTSGRSICLGYNNNCTIPVIDPTTRDPYQKRFSSNVRLAASRRLIAFDGLGRPVPNVSVRYTIQNTVDRLQPDKVIQLEAETGYVR